MSNLIVLELLMKCVNLDHAFCYYLEVLQKLSSKILPNHHNNFLIFLCFLCYTNSHFIMEDPILLHSRAGKPQLYHQGFTLCQNKKTKNHQTYFQCVHRDHSVRCTASATVVNQLEEGKFELKFHHVQKHVHEPSKCDADCKNFNTGFKARCKQKIDTSVQEIYEYFESQICVILVWNNITFVFLRKKIPEGQP